MTYCVGILIRDGLVLAADSRTNAGVDHVATFRKLTVFDRAEDRFVVVLSAGNLATSQAVVTLLGERLDDRAKQNLYTVKSMFDGARLVGATLREVLAGDATHVEAQNGDPNASFILGGQIRGRPARLFQIYAAGNFIEATPDTPYFQIGETKYGKPIIDRIIKYDMALKRAAMGALVSYDSTMRSNLSVAPPIDLVVYRSDSLRPAVRAEIGEGDAYFSALRKAYGEGIASVFRVLPEPDWTA